MLALGKKISDVRPVHSLKVVRPNKASTSYSKSIYTVVPFRLQPNAFDEVVVVPRPDCSLLYDAKNNFILYVYILKKLVVDLMFDRPVHFCEIRMSAQGNE